MKKLLIFTFLCLSCQDKTPTSKPDLIGSSHDLKQGHATTTTLPNIIESIEISKPVDQRVKCSTEVSSKLEFFETPSLESDNYYYLSSLSFEISRVIFNYTKSKKVLINLNSNGENYSIKSFKTNFSDKVEMDLTYSLKDLKELTAKLMTNSDCRL